MAEVDVILGNNNDDLALDMAVQEIAKHTKNLIRAIGGREYSLAHRLREMALEVVTIVFAVTLSIWLHGLSEHQHQQQEVRAFLIGLKSDLKDDISTLSQLKATYRIFDANFAYLGSLVPGQEPDAEKFAAAYALADMNIFFIPTRSRYEGFKSSGKLTNIENEELLNGILNLYQNLLPQIELSEGGWQARQKALRAYLDQELDYGDDSAQRYTLIVAPKGKRILKRMATPDQLYDRYDNYSLLAQKIVGQIDASTRN